MTQRQLADRLDTYEAQISNWEAGRRSISGAVQAALEDALRIPAGHLYWDPDRPSADELLRGQPREVTEKAMEIIKALIGRK